MGKFIFDQYTYLQFAVGIIVYFWGVKFKYWALIHLLFEIIENSPSGIKFINTKLTFWPGGKPKADSFINILGDNIGALLGWLAANYLDKLGVKMGWYDPHIK